MNLIQHLSIFQSRDPPANLSNSGVVIPQRAQSAQPSSISPFTMDQSDVGGNPEQKNLSNFPQRQTKQRGSQQETSLSYGLASHGGNKTQDSSLSHNLERCGGKKSNCENNDPELKVLSNKDKSHKVSCFLYE